MTCDGLFCGILGVVLAALTTRVTAVVCARLFHSKCKQLRHASYHATRNRDIQVRQTNLLVCLRCTGGCGSFVFGEGWCVGGCVGAARNAERGGLRRRGQRCERRGLERDHAEQ
jgi:hypothetical protein